MGVEMAGVLSGRRILVVEDEFLFAVYYQELLEAEGAVVVGPAAAVKSASLLAAEEDLDGAILDINLGGKLSFPVADLLEARGIPFIFVSAYGDAFTRPRPHDGRRLLGKPVSADLLMATVREEFDGSSAQA